MERTLKMLLDRSSTIELKVAEVYDLFGQCFSEDPRLHNFWRLFAEAERYHSLLIQMQKVLLSHVQLDAERLFRWQQEVEDATTYLNNITRRIREEGWSPSIPEAFMMAHEIEGRSLEIQARSLEFADQSTIGELFTSLHEEDMGHRHKLLVARSQFDPSFEAPQGLEEYAVH